MKMNKEKYEELMLRFGKEMHDVGVTEGMKKIVEAQSARTPNSASCSTEEVVRKFYYQHDGYVIEAVQRVSLLVKKSNQ